MILKKIKINAIKANPKISWHVILNNICIMIYLFYKITLSNKIKSNPILAPDLF